jgi:cardiolipin synthase
MRQRQQEYLARSHPVDAKVVAAWPMKHRLWNNTIAMLGPLL